MIKTTSTTPPWSSANRQDSNREMTDEGRSSTSCTWIVREHGHRQQDVPWVSSLLSVSIRTPKTESCWAWRPHHLLSCPWTCPSSSESSSLSLCGGWNERLCPRAEVSSWRGVRGRRIKLRLDRVLVQTNKSANEDRSSRLTEF